jgi:hypothetical protein
MSHYTTEKKDASRPNTRSKTRTLLGPINAKRPINMNRKMVFSDLLNAFFGQILNFEKNKPKSEISSVHHLSAFSHLSGPTELSLEKKKGWGLWVSVL